MFAGYTNSRVLTIHKQQNFIRTRMSHNIPLFTFSEIGHKILSVLVLDPLILRSANENTLHTGMTIFTHL